MIARALAVAFLLAFACGQAMAAPRIVYALTITTPGENEGFEIGVYTKAWACEHMRLLYRPHLTQHGLEAECIAREPIVGEPV